MGFLHISAVLRGEAQPMYTINVIEEKTTILL
jgi:hypothetical protein